jgi:hypothetical protein
MCFIDQRLGDLALDTRQADIEPDGDEIAAVREVQVYFCADRDVCRQRDVSLAGCERERGLPSV